MIGVVSQVTMSWLGFVLVILGSVSFGVAVVAIFGWNRATRAAHKLIDLLDEVSEQERILRARLQELNDPPPERWWRR